MGKRVRTNCDFRHWRHFLSPMAMHLLSQMAHPIAIVAIGGRHWRQWRSQMVAIDAILMATINGDATFKIAIRG